MQDEYGGIYCLPGYEIIIVTIENALICHIYSLWEPSSIGVRNNTRRTESITTTIDMCIA